MAPGCSWISFSMKSSNPPFWARATSCSTTMGVGCSAFPSKSVNATPSRRTSTTCPSSTGITVVVRSSTAGMSEARSVSPSPRPDDERRGDLDPDEEIGLVRRHHDERVRALELADGRAHRVGQPRLVRMCSSIRWAMHSVSVSDANTWPSFSRRTRSVWKFSMMPLWITAIRPWQSWCGCALRSVGVPWVAQRVWPIAVCPASGSAPASAASSSASLPARLTTVSSSASTATPAESYPRYSRRRRPSSTMGSAWSGPT